VAWRLKKFACQFFSRSSVFALRLFSLQRFFRRVIGCIVRG